MRLVKSIERMSGVNAEIPSAAMLPSSTRTTYELRPRVGADPSRTRQDARSVRIRVGPVAGAEQAPRMAAVPGCATRPSSTFRREAASLGARTTRTPDSARSGRSSALLRNTENITDQVMSELSELTELTGQNVTPLLGRTPQAAEGRRRVQRVLQEQLEASEAELENPRVNEAHAPVCAPAHMDARA